MKRRLIFVLVCLLLVPCIVIASPFLVSDPNPIETTHYRVAMDGVEVVADHVAEQDGSIKLDLQPLALTDGSHTVDVEACNVWGCSGVATLNFTSGVPGSTTKLRLEAN